jgi:protein-arginine kinase activator protein McsA|tara:strand:+ start:665 stop:1018 length:354 start_codon:yes stop_codon:yes gene_type:complete
MLGKRKINDLFEEFDTFFNDMRPNYYRVGPNGYIFYTNRENENNKTIDELNVLKKQLEVSISQEDFESSVKFRDKIKTLEKNGEKIKELRIELEKSITDENFEESIKLRDKIKNLIK